MKKDRKIDLTRHLCVGCKHDYPCKFTNQEFGENNNVITCKNFIRKRDLTPRVEVGDTYWVYVFIDESNPEKGFKTKQRIEMNKYIDTLYNEVGNYFHTQDNCLTEIKRLQK